MNIYKLNYKAIIKRGFISNKTKDIDFYYKLIEEVKEVECEMFTNCINEEKLVSEIIDVVNVCNNWLYHKGYDIKKELKKNAVKQLKRANNGTIQ